jgi:hypothetical protein
LAGWIANANSVVIQRADMGSNPGFSSGTTLARKPSMRRILAVPALALLVACGPDSISGGEQESDGYTLTQTFEPDHRAPRVDMILVVDDSPSMRPFTSRWAQNVGAFANVIEADEVNADIRIAITTTSVPGPTCEGPRALGGEPVLDSCLAHLEDFVGADEHGELGGSVEDLASICEEVCTLPEIPRVPSRGSDDHDLHSLAVRPWIEAPNNPTGGNLDGVELAEALACAGLQGFSGCKYESPIEAAARMVEHMGDPDHPMSEFRRADAALMILTVGDEDDCSHSDAAATIFDPAGARTFWPDPEAAEPTSAVCINAGLECDEEGCALTDHALDGTSTDDPASAVLTSTSRLHDALVAAGEFDVEPWVPYVASIGGFLLDGQVYYTPPEPGLSEDQQLYLDSFGVLPGCADPDVRAAPGGRLAAAGTQDARWSICHPDWSSALEVFAEHTGPGIQPKCIAFDCVADLEPDSELLEPDCVVEELDYQGTAINLPTCVRDEAGWAIDPQTNNYAVPEGAHACWIWQTDANQLTSSYYDDMSIECADAELPGEIRIARRPGSLLPYDSVYQLRCRPCGG